MKHSHLRAIMELQRIRSDSFIKKSRLLKESHFTRTRKLPLPMLVLSVLGRKGTTMVMEIRSFFKSLKTGESISKAGFLKQRQKLNPKVFLDLARFRAVNFYKDSSMVRRWNGFLVLAVDGSSVNIPTTKENLEIYGNASKKNTKPRAQLGLSCLYDVMNKMIIDCQTDRWKFSERKQALAHLRSCGAVTGNAPRLTIFDRGYPSGEFFLDLMEQKEYFLIRLSSADFKREQKAMQTDDEDVRIIFTKERINPHRGTPTAQKMKDAGEVNLRFVRFMLKSGETEYLVTNLSREDFSTADITNLYMARWEIETAYDILKNKFSMENFTGSKSILIQQDIYATVYLCNIMHDMLLEAQDELERRQKKYKHPMEINRNIAIGIIKEEIIAFVLEKNPRKQEELFNRALQEISKNIIPVRKGRAYKRTKGQLAGKYSNVIKRSY